MGLHAWVLVFACCIEHGILRRAELNSESFVVGLHNLAYEVCRLHPRLACLTHSLPHAIGYLLVLFSVTFLLMTITGSRNSLLKRVFLLLLYTEDAIPPGGCVGSLDTRMNSFRRLRCVDRGDLGEGAICFVYFAACNAEACQQPLFKVPVLFICELSCVTPGSLLNVGSKILFLGGIKT